MASRVLVFGVGVIGFARTEGCIYSFTYIYIYMYIFSVYTENTQIKTCHVQEKKNLFCRIEGPATFAAKAVPDHHIQACEVPIIRLESVCSFGRKAEVAVENRPFLQYLLELAGQN